MDVVIIFPMLESLPPLLQNGCRPLLCQDNTPKACTKVHYLKYSMPWMQQPDSSILIKERGSVTKENHRKEDYTPSSVTGTTLLHTCCLGSSQIGPSRESRLTSTVVLMAIGFQGGWWLVRMSEFAVGCCRMKPIDLIFDACFCFYFGKHASLF